MADDGLVVFLRERLKEEAEAAEACTPGPWRWGDWSTEFGTTEQVRRTLEHCPERGEFPALVTREQEGVKVLPSLEDALEYSDDHEQRNAAHVAYWNPSRGVG